MTSDGTAERSLAPDELVRLLIAVANDQDRQAFAAIFSYFGSRLKGFLIRTGSTSAQAEEIVQETMLLVWQKASLFDPMKAGASTWIFTIARNQRIDRQRREREGLLDHSFWERQAEKGDELPSVEAALASGQEAGLLRQAMEMLPPEQSLILRLSFFMEKPHADIARELGLPLGTVKSRARLAMRRLRDLLGDLA